jgi:broad specificity phosphatase PhoE
MGTTYLVRHGQASFGAADYDQLSPRGVEQCRRLGAYWRERGQRFDAVLCGTLRRHEQTRAAIAEGQQAELQALVWPGLNEYDSEALIHAHHPAPLPPVDGPAGYKLHFRLLREALLEWMAGRLAPVGVPAYADFTAGVMAALDHVHTRHRDATVLVVSSGGPISTAVGRLLGAAPEAVVELNLRIRNSAVTELIDTAAGHRLLGFNHLPHLDAPGDKALHTYA